MQERNVGQRKQHITVMSQEGFSPLPTIYLTFTVKVGDLVKVPSCRCLYRCWPATRLVHKCICHFLYSTLAK